MGGGYFGGIYFGEYSMVSIAVAPSVTPIQGGGIIIPRRRIITSFRQEGFEEDEAIALSLLLRTRKRLR